MIFLRIRPIGRVLSVLDLHFLLQQVATNGAGASSFFSCSAVSGLGASTSAALSVV